MNNKEVRDVTYVANCVTDFIYIMMLNAVCKCNRMIRTVGSPLCLQGCEQCYSNRVHNCADDAACAVLPTCGVQKLMSCCDMAGTGCVRINEDGRLC
jgi:hypothetical protein